MGNKILLVEPDPSLSVEISSTVKTLGYEITDCVKYIFGVINSIEIEKPDLIIYDGIMNEQTAGFISQYISIPLVIISNQYEREIYKYSKDITLLSIIHKPINIYSLRAPLSIAFSKL